MIKKTFPILIAAAVILLSACTQTKKDDTKTGLSVTDTLGLAEFQRFKLENEIRQQMMSEQQMGYTTAPAPVQYYTPARSTSTRSSARTTSSRRSSGRTYSSGNRGYSNNNGGYATTRQQPQRKRWSHTAKGAVVGGVSGAVIGAVANKRNRLGGGVVGAVVGAATGAGIGAIVDKRERNRGYYTNYGY
ncbi:MAG: hypothetical protein BGN92_05005 [Sphingobacteriales bacterium 41-5]|nr:MAG: hypothetical protein BGN92_05005 [Sphingobacteriales bacterium 41-5]